MITPHKRITRKIENSYVVWFEERNYWIQFEEPAFFVYKLYSRGDKICEISHKFSRRYGLPEFESHQFVNEVIAGIREYSSPVIIPEDNSPDFKVLEGYSFSPYALHPYYINTKKIEIAYETALDGYYLHPMLEHLQQENQEKADLSFEVFTFKQFHVLRIKGQPEKCWFFNEYMQLKRKLFIEITNTIYNRAERNWMSFIHASAVTDGIQTVLLPSASGSGKSTMAGLLLKNGLQLVSDDFVPLDAISKHAYPFPVAVSVKEGAYELFSPSQLREHNYQGLRNNSFKYLKAEITDNSWYKAHPVKKIVFIRYNPEVKMKCIRLPVLQALSMFHEEARVSASYDNAKRFINWFVGVECYRMEYSKNDLAIQKIIGLFKKN